MIAGKGRIRKILVVEDDDQTGMLIRDILGTIGYEVSHCRTSGEALRLASKINFSGVLVDVDLAQDHLSGIDVYQKITELTGRGPERMPGIVVTGSREERVRQAGRRSGIRDYLHKPFDAEQLISRVQKYIQ